MSAACRVVQELKGLVEEVQALSTQRKCIIEGSSKLCNRIKKEIYFAASVSDKLKQGRGEAKEAKLAEQRWLQGLHNNLRGLQAEVRFQSLHFYNFLCSSC